MRLHRTTTLFAATLLWSTSPMAQEPAPTADEMWQIIRQQQAQIDALRAQLAQTRQDARSANEKAEAAGDYVESFAASQTSTSGTSLGGYGELHYTRVDADAGDTDRIDFHRFVLFLGHEFNDRVHFYSELELEHSAVAGDEPGEVELEQAYVDFALTADTTARGGLFLLPVGILNEMHEPPTFYGVERNDVESIILPATWWEAGASFNGRLGNGLSWDAAMHSGLAMPTTGDDAFRVRSGRGHVAEAPASDPAYTLRLKYTGLPGLELAASYQLQTNPSQIPGDGLDRGQLFTAHAIYQNAGFGLRALYAGWTFDGDAVKAAGADRQSGWYLEPSYRINERWGFYARHENLDAIREQDRFTQNEIGLNFWPAQGVVLKMDFRMREHSLTSLAVEDFDAVDLGFGYAF